MLSSSTCSSRAATSACLGSRAARIPASFLSSQKNLTPMVSSRLRLPHQRRQQRPHVARGATASMGNFKSGDLPPEQVTRLFSVEEYEAAKEAKDKLAVVMLKAKTCRPCMAFSKKFYRAAERLKSEANFYEIYGDENKYTVKLMMEMKVKATPNFRFYKNGEEVHQHSGISEEKLLEHLEEFLGTGAASEPQEA